jgi:hypothetical protein
LLDDLDPSGFFVASASPIKGRLQFYLTALTQDVRATRIIPVSTRAVVDAQLLKSTISLADYDSSPKEMLLDVVTKRDKRLLASDVEALSGLARGYMMAEAAEVVALSRLKGRGDNGGTAPSSSGDVIPFGRR